MENKKTIETKDINRVPPKEKLTQKRNPISQSIIPMYSLERSLEIAKVICDQFAAKGGEPHLIAKTMNLSPTSNTWRMLTGSAIAYGITQGGYKVPEITITPLGKSIIIPTEDGEKENALVTAVLKPKIINDFFKKYDKAKLPTKDIGKNVLFSLGIPQERTENAFDVIVENGKFCGIITETKTGYYISVTTKPTTKNHDDHESLKDSTILDTEMEDSGVVQAVQKISEKYSPVKTECVEKVKNNRVFISHGKNKQIVDQLKEIIKFGKYEPIISVERESTSKPVPDKVLDDMRSCFAGVIIINNEGELIDQTGKTHKKINDNVLIEIGAALALYGRNNILLVQNGITLPSNLQGLYRCEYEGEVLDTKALIKLLTTFNEFS
ncbi:TIR domain-containing protein [Methanoregula formicica]|uniref:Putative nucleotide-binding protein containing TIR-like domain n=1 Tax=Methanoregula formicica (strain DSM 22288 / NBRC 105244 / SMSP) TaxID=593750 RepID=L0HBG8_METFS|nr:nucleotide-binding protein [Methanoregula formicica]AGB02092.1 putative nucleotide-binding protein containing TIR-like domain [Methanoregula formicica SMSP]